MSRPFVDIHGRYVYFELAYVFVMMILIMNTFLQEKRHFVFLMIYD
jgi:hypothetical protein